MSNKVKYFYNPAYTSADWVALNPVLAAGQIGIELDGNGLAVHIKVGPGNWNDLLAIEKDVYDKTDLVTNPLGDLILDSSQLLRPIDDILKDIISPYLPVTLADAKNDEAGAPANIVVKEVGQSVDTSVDISFTLANVANLKVGSNIFVEAGGIFSNEGLFTYDGGPITMILPASLIPSANVTYTISIYAIDAITGQTNTVQTTIVFKPVVLYVNDALNSMSEAQIGAIANRLLTNDYKQDYTIAGTGYTHIYVPVMLNPDNVLFSEQSNPSNPGGYSMTDIGLFTVNNGTGTYQYRGYVSDFSLITATVLRLN